MAGAQISPLAGKPLSPDQLVDVGRLVDAYYGVVPDPGCAAQRVRFGTSGHRGSAFDGAFNEAHVLAIAQAICLHRQRSAIRGPLFLGFDTHALSRHAFATALEVFAANGVAARVDARDGYTPTPAVSRAILAHNRAGAGGGLADGVVLTPSHNPPQDGGFKYNPPSGGPADLDVTGWIEAAANRLLERGLRGVRRVPFARACAADAVRRHDFLGAYVEDLAGLIDLEAIRAAGVRFGIDPLGGASVGYWPAIVERYGLDGTIVETAVDPAFGFMPADWDGQIRMDCSSPYAMARLIGLRDRFDLAVANDPDADRHGVVTPSTGLEPPNHYLAAAIAYLFAHRPQWGPGCAVGKTMVSSSVIDRVTQRLGRRLVEVPVGFKWFVEGLRRGELAFAGEESAGAALLRRDGSVWTTDKDGLALALVAVEMLARTGRDPGQAYAALEADLGPAWYERVDTPLSPAARDILAQVTPDQVRLADLAGQPVTAIVTVAPGNQAPLGGVKVVSADGWFAVRPSGTEDRGKIYAESFRSGEHLRALQAAGQKLVDDLLVAGGLAAHAAPGRPRAGPRSISAAHAGIREAVGLFMDPRALQGAIDELLSSGFDRADLSLLASEPVVERRLGYAVRRTDLEDDPRTPRSVYISPDAVATAEGSLIGGLAYVGGVAAAGAIALAGGPLTLIVVGAGASGLAAGLVGAELARLLGHRQAAAICAHLRRGGLLLWVRTWDAADEQRATAILRRRSGRDVHVHGLAAAAPRNEAVAGREDRP